MRTATRTERVVDAAVGAGYEFWRSDGKRTLKAAAIALLSSGFSEEDAAELIGAIWAASAEEYGA